VPELGARERYKVTHTIGRWVAGVAVIAVGCLTLLIGAGWLSARPLRHWVDAVEAAAAAVLGLAAWVAYRSGGPRLAGATLLVAAVVASGAPTWGPGYVSVLVSVVLIALGVFRYLPDRASTADKSNLGAPPN
jgi:chromate transport protein ChrA